MLARKHEILEQEQAQIQEEHIPRGKRYKKPRRNTDKKYKKFKFLTVSLFTSGFLLATSILHGHTLVTQKKIEILDIENEILELEQEKDYILVTLEEVKSSSNIEEKAMLELGMDYPSKDQMVYINVQDRLKDKSNLKKDNPFQVVVNLISSLLL